MSRSLNWRAISSAASRFTSRALLSWSVVLRDLLPEFTSMTCNASVLSIIMYAPERNETVFPNDDFICLVTLNLSKMGVSSL